jgi:hypothetical protein
MGAAESKTPFAYSKRKEWYPPNHLSFVSFRLSQPLLFSLWNSAIDRRSEWLNLVSLYLSPIETSCLTLSIRDLTMFLICVSFFTRRLFFSL